MVTLDCHVNGGNPLATLSWQCKGSLRIGQNKTDADTAWSRLVFKIDESYHQQQCVCTAKHEAMPNYGVFSTKTVLFDVIYPPTGEIWLSQSGNQSFETGTNVTLYCQINGGNPLLRLTWLCKGRRLAGVNITTRDTAGSELYFVVDTSYHQKTCVCTARHEATGQIDQASILFDILYGPIIGNFKTVEYVQEGKTFSRKCSARGNPRPTTSWFQDSKPLVTGNIIEFRNITRQDAGNYSCTAIVTHPEVSKRSKLLQIIVQCRQTNNILIIIVLNPLATAYAWCC
ncbi:kin of IRRE-like protein 2 [Pecten maximus]|uniref:kin of IRRE-like protein 2 n=1 Tax=Pecten maximus TaxID=6579 RepID=UPI001458A9B6|nr:kin of IRRE-like protein 2 [Pecten maximus]